MSKRDKVAVAVGIAACIMIYATIWAGLYAAYVSR